MIKFIQMNSEKPLEPKQTSLALEKMLNGECIIGRDQRCCIHLDDPKVSSQHGKIFLKEGQYYYTDTISRNGSKINNEDAQINQNYLLKPGDQIQIGPFILWIQSLTENVEVIPPQPPQPSQYMPLAVTDPALVKRWTEGDRTLRCTQVIEDTPDVKTFRFVASPPVLFSFQPGQFVTLNLEIDGQQVARAYSISSAPSRPHTLDITVKRVPPPSDVPDAPPGLVSNWLHNNITAGSEVKFSIPMGKFSCFVKPSQKLLLISAGSGITPMMSMARWICDTGADVDVVFFHSARSPRDIIFRQELELMDARHPNFKLAVTVTRSEPGIPWMGYTGRLNASMLQAIAPDLRDRTVYVCGPNAFMESAKSILEELGFPMENYNEESFGGKKKSKPKATSSSASATVITQLTPRSGLDMLRSTEPEPISTSASTNGNHATGTLVVPKPTTLVASETIIVFQKSGKEVPCDGEDSILEVAEEAGLQLTAGCRMGSCGVCKQKLLEGEVNYEQDPGCEPGQVLTCIAKPVGRVVIDA